MASAWRPADALRTLRGAIERFPGNTSLEFVRGNIVFSCTGQTGESRAALDRASRDLSAAMLIDSHFFVLRLERRYADLRALVDGISESYVRAVAGLGRPFSLG